MKKILGFLLLSFSLNNSSVFSQGCSDAGVCTIHAIKTGLDKKDETRDQRQRLALGTGYARGERGTDLYNLQLEYSYRFISGLTLTGKMNYQGLKGELGRTNGPGDLVLSAEKDLAGAKWEKSVFGGFKIPIGKSDISQGGRPLPMVYQPSLGTVDLLAGIRFSRRDWQLALAWQQPLSGANKNRFLASDYPPSHIAQNYPPSRLLNRKADLVARITHGFSPGKKWMLQPGLLGIYHTGKDQYRNETGQGVTIDGSAGLTLNAVVQSQWKTGKTGSILLTGGTPLLVRAARPDGLTRKFVLSLEYAFRF